MSKRKIALFGMLTALALVLSYVESLIPAFFAIPGMKLGITNIVVLTAMYIINEKAALIINVVRIFAVALLFGSILSFIFSICGGILSFAVMLILKRTNRFSTVAVSAAGGVAHNIGQIAAAAVIFQSTSVLWYLAILWLTGAVSGLLIGLLGGVACKRLLKIMK